MKVCKYCFTETNDDVMQCKHCGSNEFSNICKNCEEKFSGTVCPNCGIAVSEKPRTCYNCGKTTYEKVCPNCGFYLVNSKGKVINQLSDDTKEGPGCLGYLKLAFRCFVVLIFLIIFASMIIAIITGIKSSKNGHNATSQNNLSNIEIVALTEYQKFYGNYK